MSPFTPHICEELWQKMGASKENIIREKWPVFDQEALKQDMVQIVVQVNGKLRGRFDVPVGSNEEQVREIFLADAKIKKFIDDKPIKKFIYVSGKIANFVV